LTWPQQFAASKTRQPKTMLKIIFKFFCVFILFGFVCLKAYSDQRYGELTKNLQSDGNNRSIATGFFVTDSGHLITAHHVVKNAKTMATAFSRRGYKVVSNGTENHLFLVDLIDKGITGKDAGIALGNANITVNKNAVPNDPQSPFVTSGLRIGTPAITTRGMQENQVQNLAHWMCDILEDLGNTAVISRVRQQVLELCEHFPVYRVRTRIKNKVA